MSSCFDKLAKIEALIQRATSEGEREAAKLAKERVLNTMFQDVIHQPTEYRVSLASPWEKRLFVAICNKHGYKTYRYQRQKYTTARLKISKNMMETVLWPEYQHFAKLLREVVEEITLDLINKIHKVDEEEILIAGEIDLQEA